MRKVRDLQGREYKFNLTGYQVLDTDTRPRSSHHLACRQLLRRLYTATPICEEVVIPGMNGMKLDFLLPLTMQYLAVEVNGPQHYTRKSIFHRTKREFLDGQRRDRSKARWCELNNIRLVVLRWDEPIRWESQISDCTAED
jgi:hypothetical protein